MHCVRTMNRHSRVAAIGVDWHGGATAERLEEQSDGGGFACVCVQQREGKRRLHFCVEFTQRIRQGTMTAVASSEAVTAQRRGDRWRPGSGLTHPLAVTGACGNELLGD
jgi:hypothetical protein